MTVARIVLDANFPSRGHFSAGRLRYLVDSLIGSHVEIIVPEVVVWEWAEHAVATLDALVEQHKRLRVDRSLYPAPSMPEPPAKEDLVTILSRALPKEITVWKPTHDEWRAAVRAQILQTGSGERKQGVKTGAADHLVMACVQEQLDERLEAEAIVLASRDKKLQRVCQTAFGEDVLYASSDQELLTRLVEFRPVADELIHSVEEEIRYRVNDPMSDIGAALETFSSGFSIIGRHEPLDDNQRELARLGAVDIVELHDLEVGQHQEDARLGHADLRIFANVHMTVLEMQHEAGDIEWLQTFSGLVKGGMIDLEVNVTFDRDWNVISVAPATAAQIDFEPSDGDEDIRENLDT